MQTLAPLYDPAYAPPGSQLDAPRAEKSAPDGLLVIDKPLGITSHDVVSKLRRLAATRKVGHAGTLDPAASGVLVAGVGKGTKILQFAQASRKTYTARVCLGVETSTEDAQGQVTSARGLDQLPTDAQFEALLADWRGPIMQVPSKVSAIKIDGKKALTRVLAGEDVQLKARPVTIYRLERVSEITAAECAGVHVGYVDILVQCSAGTYVRALARDLGLQLGCGAHLQALRRIEASGLHVGKDTYDLRFLADTVQAGRPLPVLPLPVALQKMFAGRTLYVSERQALALSLGQKVELPAPETPADDNQDYALALPTHSQLARNFYAVDQCQDPGAQPCDLVVGIYNYARGKWQAKVVLTPDLRGCAGQVQG